MYTGPKECASITNLKEGKEAHSQRELSQLIHRKTWDQIAKGDNRTRAFRASLEHPGAKDWITPQSSPSILNYIKNHRFRTWLKFYARLPLWNNNETFCPRPRCQQLSDTLGDHLLSCRFSSLVGSTNPTSRHDRQVRLLAEDLKAAARNPVVEPKEREVEEPRPDIRALGRGGGYDVIDVTVCHTFGSPSAQARTIASYSLLTRSASKPKETRHEPLLELQTGGRIVLIVFNIAGDWEPRSYEFARALISEMRSRSDSNRAQATALFFQRHAIRLIISNMHTLTHDPR